jgi:hypothetical protein
MAAWVAVAGAYEQRSNPIAGTPPSNPESMGNTSSLPTVTVTAKVLQQRIDTYVSKLSGANVWSDDHPMARWRTSICPIVAGLPREEGHVLFDHLSGVLASMNISLGSTGCRPNFFVIASADPGETLKSLWHHAPNMNGGETGFTQFIETPRPVRVWYNTELTNEDGAQANFFGVGSTPVFEDVPTVTTKTTDPRHKFWANSDLSSVIALVDLRRMAGLNWGQVAEYIAMAGVAEVNLDARGGEAPTIMSLFSASAEARPEGLSDWDRSFIKQLYATDSFDKHQRVWIAKAMFNDVAPDSAKRN